MYIAANRANLGHALHAVPELDWPCTLDLGQSESGPQIRHVCQIQHAEAVCHGQHTQQAPLTSPKCPVLGLRQRAGLVWGACCT